MFNLGYRQVVLNTADDVKQLSTAFAPLAPTAPTAANFADIPGFGRFLVRKAADVTSIVAADASSNWIVSPVLAATEKITVTGPTAVLVGESYIVEVFFTATERPLSEIFPERGTGGIRYQSGKVTSATGLGAALVASAVIPGFNDIILKFSNAAGNSFDIEMLAGYEGVNIERVQLTPTKDQDESPTSLVFAVGTLGTVGIGQGKQIEAEVRNATFDNIDPYGIQFGGNSQGVDVRGQYVTIKFSLKDEEDGPGWEPHAMLGYGDANTSTTYADRNYIIYAHASLFDDATSTPPTLNAATDVAGLLMAMAKGA